MLDKHIIRTSDRKAFKECRQAWDFGSKIRMNYEPIVISKHLEFGTAIHSGLEQYYTTMTFPLETNTALAITSFIARNEQQWLARGTDDPEIGEEYKAREELGIGMLNYYCGEWAPKNDKFKVVAVELEFEVPVFVPHGTRLPLGFDRGGQSGYQLYYKGKPVVYQGRIDLIVEDEYGELWIVDHKTVGSMKEDNFYLDVDTQVTSYAWAAQFFMDKPIAGVIYNQLWKSYPKPPNLVYKDTRLSKDKSQGTTYDLYIKAIREHGFDEDDYSEFLDYLFREGPTFVRRFELHRSKIELDNQGAMIYAEAVDMLGSPSIYHNPSEFRCNSCPFQGPCLSRIDGSDFRFILDSPQYYRKRINVST